MEYLHGWVFVYNPYISKWMAAERGDTNDLYNDHTSQNVLRSSQITTLLSLLSKHKHKTAKEINKLKTFY